MKRPDRKRKRARSERLEPLPPPPGGPILPAPLPGATPPSPPGPASAPGTPAPSAPTPTSVRPKAKVLVLIGVITLSGVVGLAASHRTAAPKGSSPAPAPTPARTEQPKPRATPAPLGTLEPLQALPEAPVAVSKPKPPEKVNPEKRLAGNGYPLLLDALARIQTATVAASRDLQKALAAPGTPLGSDGFKFVHDSWPAIQALEQAARSETFAAVGSQSLDFGKLDTVVTAALAVASTESATRVALGREAVRVARVGHALAGSGGFLESAMGLAQARKAEKWLRTSFEKEPWNCEELAWIAGELDGLLAARASVSVEKLEIPGPADQAEKRRTALARSMEAEKNELDELRKLAHAKAAAGRKGT